MSIPIKKESLLSALFSNERTTVQEIADVAKVSTATVSRTIHGSGPVRSEKRDRVLAGLGEKVGITVDSLNLLSKISLRETVDVVLNEAASQERGDRITLGAPIDKQTFDRFYAVAVNTGEEFPSVTALESLLKSDTEGRNTLIGLLEEHAAVFPVDTPIEVFERLIEINTNRSNT